MNDVKVISLGYAVPDYEYSQRQIFEALKYPHHFWRLFRDAQIDKRHFCLPIEKALGLSFQEQQEAYITRATHLARRAIANCLDGRDIKQVGLLTYATCTGFSPGPTIPDYLALELSMREDVQLNNLSSQGCEAAFPGLRRCHDFTALTGEQSLAVACELSSLTAFPEPDGKPDPDNNFQVARSNSIFADGCSCALLGYDDDPRHPAICDFATARDRDYIGDLGYKWVDGRLKVVLSRDVPKLAVGLLRKVIAKLLAQNQLEVPDIAYWVVHPPGAVVLDMLRDKLPLPEEKLKYSRKALRQNGNTSSSTVGIVAKLLIEEEDSLSGYLVMANVGPGMVGNACLMRFG